MSERGVDDAMPLSVEAALAQVGDQGIAQLLDPALLGLVRATSEGHLSAKDRVDLILDIRGRVDLLRNADSRNILFSALRAEQATRLCIALGIGDANDPWGALSGLSVRRNSKTESELFDWFLVPEDDRLEAPPEPMPETDADVMPIYGLFPHQRTALRRISTFLNDPRQPRAFLHMPTGSGKTRTAMNLICRELLEGEPKSILWLAYNGELCEQAASEFERAWAHLGDRPVAMQRYWGPHDVDEVTEDGVIFVGLDKLWSRNKRDNTWLVTLGQRLDLVVFDEAHQSVAETYKMMVEIMLLNERCKLLGLSATPGRTWNDPELDRELANLYHGQKVALEVTGYDSPLDFLVAEEYLSTPVFHDMTPPGRSLTEQDRQRILEGGDFSEAAMDRLTDDDERNLLIVQKVQDLIRDGHTRILIFATNVRHSALLATYMQHKGIAKAASITGDTPSDLRERWLSEFIAEDHEGPIVLCNFGVLTTGFDAPKTSAAIIARPTTSLVLYSQMVGRVIRGARVGGTASAEIWTVVDQERPGFGSLSEAFWNWEDVW
jgi:DNA repair protein RadD